MTSRRKKSRTDGGFVMVSRQMTRSVAYRSLSSRAGWLLHGLMDRYDGSDNRVPMSLREAMSWLHSGSDKASAALKELRKKGFIRCHELGGFTRKVRHASVWTLTMFGRGGQKATLDFLEWRPSENSEHGTQGECNTAPEASAMDPPLAPEAGAVSPDNGTRGECNTAPEASALIEYTRGEEPPKKRAPAAPIGNLAAKAAWLRSHLKAGTLTRAGVARALEIDPPDVEPIAAGQVGISNTRWQKVAALVQDWMVH